MVSRHRCLSLCCHDSGTKLECPVHPHATGPRNLASMLTGFTSHYDGSHTRSGRRAERVRTSVHPTSATLIVAWCLGGTPDNRNVAAPSIISPNRCSGTASGVQSASPNAATVRWQSFRRHRRCPRSVWFPARLRRSSEDRRSPSYRGFYPLRTDRSSRLRRVPVVPRHTSIGEPQQEQEHGIAVPHDGVLTVRGNGPHDQEEAQRTDYQSDPMAIIPR